MFHSGHIPESPLCANQRGPQSICWRGKTTSSPNMGRKPQVQASLFSVKWIWTMRGAEMVQKSPCRKRKASTRFKGQLSSSDCPTKSKTRHQTTKVCNSIPRCSAPRKNIQRTRGLIGRRVLAAQIQQEWSGCSYKSTPSGVPMIWGWTGSKWSPEKDSQGEQGWCFREINEQIQRE